MDDSLTFTIVYNNVPYNEKLTTAWGMSCLIELSDKNILFDTGGMGTILLDNMRKLKIDPKKINIVVLSHIHADHVGGLWSFLEKNKDVVVYLPESFPESFKKRVRQIGAGFITVKKHTKICENVYSTGELGGVWMREQSLIIDTPKGLIVVTGCAHPGIVNIVKKAKDLLNKNVYLVLGGFHLMGYSDKEVKRIIKGLKALGVEKIAPSHCTGGRPIELFREAWKKNFLDLGCGAVFKMGD
jgi:7,8-dihydropterin-6-yl-methyl-4-(beta-D-ribofuranosyl)aminobenzene 5'-phosphate synthase